MEKHNRRKFIKDIALAGGAITLATEALEAFTFFQQGKKRVIQINPIKDEAVHPVDFRFSPSTWQSTFCFPDDPNKSLVGKFGELLYGHPGLNADIDAFAEKVWFGLKGTPKGEYVEQKIESAGIPIYTTMLKFPDAQMKIITFATNHKDEGRVDNVLVEITPTGKAEFECTPIITVATKQPIELDDDDSDLSTLLIGDDQKTLFLAVDKKVVLTTEGDSHTATLQAKTISETSPYKFFARFPQAGQKVKVIEDGLEEPKDMLKETETFWNQWNPFDGKVTIQVQPKHQEFLVSSARNILQSRTIKNGKKAFQVGPTVYRGLWVIDGTFLLEAARYMGYDKEAQEGLESIWNLQRSDGGIFAGGGEKHWKDTAAAIYMLIRQAELAQDWQYFDELWPDMHKAAMFLRSLRDKAVNDGTVNGNYGILPNGFGDSGIGGTRPELTNTLWTLIALKEMVRVGDKYALANRSAIRDFYRDLLIGFQSAKNKEWIQHEKGFKFLPMLSKEDPKWKDVNPLNRPKVQAAQIYVSHAIYPGLLFANDDPVVGGHVELMKSVMNEDIPAETGWLSNDAVWPYNAPIFAQVCLWMQQPLLARRVFHGFLNHASPMLNWREEQTLRSITPENFIGDMPHNWASAECIRYLRHSFIMEDDKVLRLFDGLIDGDLVEKKPFTFTASPTRWGRVSLTLEPLDERSWKAKFKRENFDEKRMPTLHHIEFPRKISSKLQFDKIEGKDAKYFKNGGRVIVEPTCLEWEATWRIFGRQ